MLRNESLELAQRCSQKAQLMLHVFPVQQPSLSDVPKQRAILRICSNLVTLIKRGTSKLALEINAAFLFIQHAHLRTSSHL